MQSRLSRTSVLAVIAMLFTCNLWAQYSETGKYMFHRPYGSAPTSLVTDGAGNFYGVAGGGSTACTDGCGLVFKISPFGDLWKETVLHSFTGGSDGYNPLKIVLDSAGDIYGVTQQGGANGGGVVFKMTPRSDGGYRFLTLHAFPDGSSDGLLPTTIVLDSKGNVYGGTASDQAGDCHTYGCGVIFRLSPTATGTWGESILHHFTGVPDGMSPYGNMILDGADNLYGTTSSGGVACDGNNLGCGSVYQLTYSSGSWSESILYTFDFTNGESPASLVEDASGNLYGVTVFGGLNNGSCYSGCGTVFELSPSTSGWTGSSIYQLPSNGADGLQPNAVITNGGNLYIAMTDFEQGEYGGVIELSPSASGWTETPLFGFANLTQGSDVTSLLMDASGNIFGTTLTGGDTSSLTSGDGVFFEISPSPSSSHERVSH